MFWRFVVSAMCVQGQIKLQYDYTALHDSYLINWSTLERALIMIARRLLPAGAKT